MDPTEEKPTAPNYENADDAECEGGEDATFEAELKAHKKRCQRLKRFMPKGSLTKTDLPVAEAVEKRLPKFTRDVVQLARKHGESLCKGENLKSSNVDGEMAGMVLFNQLQPSSANDFAPVNEPLAE